MPDTLCSAGANIMLGGSSKERLTQAIRRKGDLREARSCFEMGQLISLYDAFLKKICRSFARSIPREDRLQLAREAFVNAFFSHKPNLENLTIT